MARCLYALTAPSALKLAGPRSGQPLRRVTEHLDRESMTMSEYLDQATHRKLKSQLTRAKNAKDPIKVLGAVESALAAWDGRAWPDSWHDWSIALGDAWQACRWQDAEDVSVTRRFRSAFDQMRA